MRRHLITCEFPPQLGGVSDYTNLVATDLAAAGDEVHVWCPGGETPETLHPFKVHRYLQGWSPACLRRVDKALSEYRSPQYLIVQWVPHGYGYKSLNLPFCLWLWKRAKFNTDAIALMVHEPNLTFNGGGFKQFLAAFVHRIMLVFLLSAASRVWLSTSAWEPRLRPYSSRRTKLEWLPIPSNIPVMNNPESVSNIRAQYCSDGGSLLGHFGTYGQKVGNMLHSLLASLLQPSSPDSVLLMGQGSIEFRQTFANANPSLANRVFATGPLDRSDVSFHIQACDLMLQPYPDGITTRRTSVMASLQHGRPVVSTFGALTESFWHHQSALVLESADDMPAMAIQVQKLISHTAELKRLGQTAKELYQSRFHIDHTIAALQSLDIPVPVESKKTCAC